MKKLPIGEYKKIVVWFSCGAASAVAAKLTLDLHPSSDVRIVNTPVPEEDKDNQRFLNDAEKWLGVKIEKAVNNNQEMRSCDDVWKKNYMSTPYGAACTRDIKKRARQQWEGRNIGYFPVLGFTYDELDRHTRFVETEREILPILINKKITKADCYMFLLDAGLVLPRVYQMGYPNANCVGCSKSTSPTYWNLVRKTHPDVFEKRCEQSDRFGAKLVRYKGKRVHLRDLPQDAVGRPLKNMDFECGIFCAEK